SRGGSASGQDKAEPIGPSGTATLRSRGNASSVSAGMWSSGTENYGVGRGAGEAGSVCATNLKYAVVKAAAANGTVRLCATSEPSQMSRNLGRRSEEASC